MDTAKVLTQPSVLVLVTTLTVGQCCSREKKQLPVLEGPGVPAPAGKKGMVESLEICSYIVALADSDRRVAPATGRGDVADWFSRMRKVGVQLHRPRIVKMPIQDFADTRDIEYSKWSHIKLNYDYDEAEKATSQYLEELHPILSELEPMFRGTSEGDIPCLNAWGFSMDDVTILSYLRNLTCIRDIEWPATVQSYVEKTYAAAGVPTYSQHAC